MNEHQKLKEVMKYSDPVKVAKKINDLGLNLYISTKKDKKYMIIHPEYHRIVHFGQMGYQDFTRHNDEERRQRFLNRNKRWKNAPKYSPAWLSYHILW